MGFRHLFQGKIPTSTSPLTGSSTRVLILGKKDELHIIFAIVFITNRWLIDWQCDWLIGYSRMAEAIKYKRPFRGNGMNIFCLNRFSYCTVHFFVLWMFIVQYIKIRSDKTIQALTDINMNIIRPFSKRSEERKKCCDSVEFPNAFSTCKFDTNWLPLV